MLSLEFFHGEEILGYYASMVYIIAVGNMVVSALGDPSMPVLSKLFSSGYLKKFFLLLLFLSSFSFLVGASGIIFSCLLGREILTIIYGAIYGHYSGVFILVMIAGLFTYLSNILFLGIISTRKFGLFFRPYLILTILTVFLSIIIISKFSIIGAAYVLIVTKAISSIIPIFLFFIIIKQHN